MYVNNIGDSGAPKHNSVQTVIKVHKKEMPEQAPAVAPEKIASEQNNSGEIIKVDLSEKALNLLNRRVSLSIDEPTGKVVFQIPPEEMLEFSVKFDAIIGRFFNKPF